MPWGGTNGSLESGTEEKACFSHLLVAPPAVAAAVLASMCGPGLLLRQLDSSSIHISSAAMGGSSNTVYLLFSFFSIKGSLTSSLYLLACDLLLFCPANPSGTFVNSWLFQIPYFEVPREDSIFLVQRVKSKQEDYYLWVVFKGLWEAKVIVLNHNLKANPIRYSLELYHHLNSKPLIIL